MNSAEVGGSFRNKIFRIWMENHFQFNIMNLKRPNRATEEEVLLGSSSKGLSGMQ